MLTYTTWRWLADFRRLLLLGLVSTAKWISILLISCWSDRWNTVAFRNIFTVSGVIHSVNLWLLLHEVGLPMLLTRFWSWSLVLVLVKRIISTISLCFQHFCLVSMVSNLTVSSRHSLRLHLSLINDSSSTHRFSWILLDVVDIDVINSIIKITNIESQTIVVYKFNIIHLFVNILIPTRSWHCCTWWYISNNFRSNIFLWSSWSFILIITYSLIGIWWITMSWVLTIEIFKIVHIFFYFRD